MISAPLLLFHVDGYRALNRIGTTTMTTTEDAMTIRFRPATLFVAALIALSGCATGAGDDLLPVVPGGDPADDLLPVDPSNDDELLPINAPPDTPECTRGVWLLDNESYRDLMQQFAQPSGGTVRSVTGQVVLTFGDGDTFESLYDGWKIVTDTQDGSATIERNGVDAGSVRYDTGTMTLIEERPGSRVEGFVDTPNGQFPLPNVGSSAELINETVGYGCAGEFLTVRIPEGDLSFRRL